MASSSHAEIADVLTRAIHTVFSEWTALGMAVENEWGGRNTRDKALALLQQVCHGMLTSEAVHADELEALLDSALLDDFNIEAEDDSPAQIARLLCTLHAEAKAGQLATANALLAKAAAKRPENNWIAAPLPPKARKAGDSSDEEGDEGEEAEQGMAVDGSEGVGT
eukprot:CAMPEP_0202794506 /NCGR_PEP_ID=MMETSP1388-20130828/88179_1 /ASSEMBLY_ACC=CAM_ASM_000864 /TAXON_ID=37098 /ORGANISM="Isochrysis sp, Strain CCMP1244" /LENGTH=165 /DNA_ID=CAMNT_0049464353 /DNA_START=15 /DNA_END=509 /DNA_ORIENTATION=+